MSYTDFILHAGLLFGYVIIFAIIFAESGLLIGFFLPGDSLLLTLGLLAARGSFSLPILLIVGCVAAILGDSVGYATGRTLGKSFLNRPDSRFFKKEYIEKAEAFYQKHGKKTIILSRFTPVVRTFAPIIAGTAKMPYQDFVFYNIIGGISWVCSMTLLGYFAGSYIPNIDHYILPIIALIVLASVVPALFHLKKSKKKSSQK